MAVLQASLKAIVNYVSILRDGERFVLVFWRARVYCYWDDFVLVCALRVRHRAVVVCAATSAPFCWLQDPLRASSVWRGRYQEQHGEGLQVAVGRAIMTRDLHS